VICSIGRMHIAKVGYRLPCRKSSSFRNVPSPKRRSRYNPELVYPRTQDLGVMVVLSRARFSSTPSAVWGHGTTVRTRPCPSITPARGSGHYLLRQIHRATTSFQKRPCLTPSSTSTPGSRVTKNDTKAWRRHPPTLPDDG
jgi:hypothetical protein